MIELKDLKPGDVYESSSLRCEIVKVGKNYVVEKYYRLEDSSYKGRSKKTGRALKFFLHWLNCERVRKKANS